MTKYRAVLRIPQTTAAPTSSSLGQYKVTHMVMCHNEIIYNLTRTCTELWWTDSRTLLEIRKAEHTLLNCNAVIHWPIILLHVVFTNFWDWWTPTEREWRWVAEWVANCTCAFQVDTCAFRSPTCSSFFVVWHSFKWKISGWSTDLGAFWRLIRVRREINLK